MLEVIGVLLFLWLMGKVSGLLFRLAWGAVKAIAILLLAAALPMLAAGLLCAGGTFERPGFMQLLKMDKKDNLPVLAACTLPKI